MSSLGKMYNFVKKYNFLHSVFIGFAHLMGIWEPSDYIRIGRKADRGMGGCGQFIIKLRRNELAVC